MPGQRYRLLTRFHVKLEVPVSLVRPHYYWTELRTSLTSNSQWPAVAPLSETLQATRNPDDEYVRSIWWADTAYMSPGTSTTYGWWATSSVRLVISWDPNHLQAPSDVGDNDPLTLGFMDLVPTYSKMIPTTAYMLNWTMDNGPLVLQTPRLGLGEGVRPAVLASLYYFDQNGFFSKSAEASALLRARITGRVLWASSSAS